MTTSRTRRPVAGLAAGTTTKEWLRLPTGEAARRLREVARLVADIPRDSSTDVLWVLGDSHLLVHTGDVALALEPGLATVTLPVACDQTGETTVDVPFAVGTTKELRGLFASAFTTPLGPATVTALWSDALTAFAWESLITTAQHLAAEAGRDRRDRPLVPAAIAAERGALLVKPMARNGE